MMKSKSYLVASTCIVVHSYWWTDKLSYLKSRDGIASKKTFALAHQVHPPYER